MCFAEEREINLLAFFCDFLGASEPFFLYIPKDHKQMVYITEIKENSTLLFSQLPLNSKDFRLFRRL